jgi:hypothetical protein
MLKDTEQESWKYRVATFNAHLHKNGICPANHNVSYSDCWYYYDGKPRQRPDVTRKSKEMEERDDVEVRFSEVWNTYVLSHVDPETGFAERGEVAV